MDSINPNPPDEAEFPNQPKTVVEHADIVCRHPETGELPENPDQCIYSMYAYSTLQKLNFPDLQTQYPGQYYLHQFLIGMYRRAYEEGTILIYAYNGLQFLEFPLYIGTDVLYAVSVPNTRKIPPWFFRTFRKGGKLNDFSYFGNTDEWYRILDRMADLSAAGITSRSILRRHIEDAFLEALTTRTLYRYVHRDTVCHEFSLGIPAREGNRQISVTFGASDPKIRWKFIRFNYRSLDKSMEEEICRDEERLWRSEESKLQESERRKEEQKRIEAEYLRKEAEKNLIAFEPFFLSKIRAPESVDFLHRVERFAYLPPVSVYFPQKGIDLRDEDSNRSAVSAAFAACNPYQDIDYYIENGKKKAELKVVFPGHEDRIFYACFESNAYRHKQPWYLDRFMYGTRFERTFRITDYTVMYRNFCSVAEDTGIGPDEFPGFLSREFITAISDGTVYYYGDSLLKRVELPLPVKSRSNAALHLVFTLSADRKWVFSGFRERLGDVRFAISDEYKAEREEKLHRAVSEPEAAEVPQIPAVKPAAVLPKEPQFTGTVFTGPDGKPLSLRQFAKWISVDKLQDLAKMAEPEKWDWKGGDELVILYRYLDARFVRLGYESKIGYYHDDNDVDVDYVVFHTGLFSREAHDPIYACLKPVPQFSSRYEGPKWFMDGFCCHSQGGDMYEHMRAKFPVFPPDADFFRENGIELPATSYVMDVSQPVELREEHIFRERGYRLPYKFLERAFSRDAEASAYLQKLSGILDESARKSFWVNEFSEYLDTHQETYDRLLQLVGHVVDASLHCSLRRPIPAYYPRDNVIHWLLPLRFHEKTDLKNIVLVTGRRDAGGYKGITVMTVEMVYYMVRTVGNPDSYWLNTEVLDADGDEDEDTGSNWW